MTLGFLYWFFVLLMFLFGGAWGYRVDRSGGFIAYAPFGTLFFVFVLLIILGLKVFGWPVTS